MKIALVAGAVLAVLSVGVAVSVVSAMGDSPPAVADGDRHRVTTGELRERLARSGLRIQPLRRPLLSVTTVAGRAALGQASIGFEFQVYPSSDIASIRRLGTLRPQDFGWAERPGQPLFRTWIRGVLGNVAYAQYELETDQQFDADAARRRIIRALDEVLFGAFPRDDPYANALIPAD